MRLFFKNNHNRDGPGMDVLTCRGLIDGAGMDQIAIFKSLAARNATFLLDLIWIASPRLWNLRKQHRQI